MTITIPLRRRASARGRRRRRRHRIPLSSRPQPQQGDRWLQEGESSPHLPPSTAYSLVTTGGSHFLTLAVGTPPQPQAVIVDTGSTLTAFGCVPGCDFGCGTHTYPFFALDKSSSARTLTCGECGTQCLDDKCLVSQRYSEGSSWRAFSVEDRVGLMGMGGTRSAGQQQADDSAASGANDTIPFVFGCQTKLTGLFVPQKENGIMGLSRGPENFISRLKAAGKIPRASFSICFDEDEEDGGRIMIGGGGGGGEEEGKAEMKEEGYVFASLTSSPNGWFLVDLAGLSLGGRPLSSPLPPSLPSSSSSPPALTLERRRHALLDSGTTDTYLLLSDLPSFSSLFKQATNNKLEFNSDASYHLSLHEILLLPSLEVEFRKEEGEDGKEEGVVKLVIPPLSYMEEIGVKGQEKGEKEESMWDGGRRQGVWVPRVYFTERSLIILGSNAMRGHDILFDMEGERVGLRRVVSCSYRRYKARNGGRCAEMCTAPVTGRGGSVTAVCGVDGESYGSTCEAACVLGSSGTGSNNRIYSSSSSNSSSIGNEATDTLLLWDDGPCPSFQQQQQQQQLQQRKEEDEDVQAAITVARRQQYRSLLFSGAPGCIEIARALLLRPKAEGKEGGTGKDLPSPSLMCNNPCFEAAQWINQQENSAAATAAASTSASNSLVEHLPLDFCARNHEGKYCQEIYTTILHTNSVSFSSSSSSSSFSASFTTSSSSLCQALQNMGCCFHHLLPRFALSQNTTTHLLHSCPPPPSHLHACTSPPSALFRQNPSSSASSSSSFLAWCNSLSAAELVLVSSFSLLSLLLLVVASRWTHTLALPLPLISRGGDQWRQQQQRHQQQQQRRRLATARTVEEEKKKVRGGDIGERARLTMTPKEMVEKNYETVIFV